MIDSGVSSWGFSSGKWWCRVVELYIINDGRVTSVRVIELANSGEPIHPNWKSLQLKWNVFHINQQTITYQTFWYDIK